MAATSSASQDITFMQMLEYNYLECSLCFETYKQPKSLTCQHAFCLKCLEKYLEHHKVLECPVCREETVIPGEGLAKLKNNFLLKSLTDEAAIFKKQKIRCNNCCEEKIATMVCADCALYMCEDCYKMHQGVKTTREGHNSFDITKLSQISNLHQFQRNRFEMCQIHKEPKKLFCKTENIQICHTCCFTSAHRKHDIWSLQEEIDKIVSNIDNKVDKMQTMATEISLQNENLKKLASDAAAEIQLSLQCLDDEKANLLKEVEKQYSEKRNKITKVANDIQCQLTDKIVKNKTIYERLQRKCKSKDALQMIPIRSCIDAATTMLDECNELCSNHIITANHAIIPKYIPSETSQDTLPIGCIKEHTLSINKRKRKYSNINSVVVSCLQEEAKYLKVGDKVVRGPHWEYEDEDGNPPTTGVLMQIAAPGTKYRYQVKWRSGREGNYRMGEKGKYDLKLPKH